MSRVHPALRYSSARIMIFVVVAGVLWLVHVRGLWLLVIALLVSGLASFVLLSRQRDAVSIAVTQSAERRRAKSQARVAREDAEDDAQRREHGED